MRISLFNEYYVFDAGKQSNIDVIIEKLPDFKDLEVTIDFTNCLIDYPATSKLIDKVLNELSLKKGKKSLHALSDLTINNESLILSLMIWGSHFFDFSSIQRTSDANAYRDIMSKKLQEYQIDFNIILLKDDGSTFKQYDYE